MLIIALGCGFFTGLKATEPDMVEAATKYLEENSLMDLRLRSNIGVRSTEIAAVRAAEGVRGAYAGYTKDLYYFYDGQNVVLKAFSVIENILPDSPNYLNRPHIMQGRLPREKNECAVEVKISSPDTFVIGNSLTLTSPDPENDPLENTLACDTFTIVGIIISPMYIGFERDSSLVGNGSVQSNIFIPETAFTCDHYTDMYVSLDLPKGLDPFSEEYRTAVNEYGAAAIKAFTDSETSRYDKLVSDAKNKIKSAQNSIALAQEVLQADDSQLKKMYAGAARSLSELNKRLGNSDNVMAMAAIANAKKKLKMLDALIHDENGTVRAQYEQELDSAHKDLEEGKALIENAPELLILNEDRFAQNDYSAYRDDADKIDAVSKVFPAFFILIAALVCVTAMTRMVEEQRTTIGAYRALGYTEGAVFAKYLVYGGIAAILGSTIGSAIGMQLFPRIIINTYRLMYNIPDVSTPFRTEYMLAALAVSFLLTTAASWFTCAKTLKAPASEIMRPAAPVIGKRILLENVTVLWNRFSFLTKVTLRNLFRYKRRFIMTVIGVAGSTALVTAGFGLRYSVAKIVDLQFGHVMCYTAAAALNTSLEHPENALDEIDGVSGYTTAVTRSVMSGTGERRYQTTLVAYDGTLQGFINMHDNDGNVISPDNNGAVINQKLAKLCGLKVGDNINVVTNDGKDFNIPVTGIMKNYALNFIYVDHALYQKLSGDDSASNTAYLNAYDSEEFRQRLISDERILGAAYLTDTAASFRDRVDNLNVIVFMLTASAGALALVVLYNLADINLTERHRELAVVKVIGFFDSEAAAYIYRENIISTAVGIILGMGVGKLLHSFVLATVESEAMMFDKGLAWQSYIFGALLTAVFSAAVNVILYYKVKTIDMAESLKSVD